MNSFRLTAVGDLGRNPELSIKGDITFARFCLVGNDEVSEGERDGPREAVTSIWFLAFDDIATTIAEGSRKGAQLILEARVIANHWTDEQGERRHGHTFIVTGFRFGARRGERGSPISVRPDAPDKPLIDAVEAEMEVTA
jgi:single-stranded DNA-binding protein